MKYFNIILYLIDGEWFRTTRFLFVRFSIIDVQMCVTAQVRSLILISISVYFYYKCISAITFYNRKNVAISSNDEPMYIIYILMYITY